MRNLDSVLRGSSHLAIEDNENSGKAKPTPELTTYGGIKLGWIQGCAYPLLAEHLGVMLFLRIAWIVAQAGIGLSVLIILISGLVCVITTLSLSAICTNGGVYYLVSRSLGAELGASVGIIFAFANAVAASMNTIGFCESLNELLKSHNLKILDNGVNDIRIVGTVALFVMCLICAIGMDWETKTQNFLITVIVLAIATYIVGAIIGPRTDLERAKGFVGISLKTAASNMGPDFRFSEGEHHNFFSVFAMYFPAVTGVQAGANICGDLKDPASAIPKGTLLALAISLASYLAMAVLSGMGALRDASGNVTDLAAGTLDSCKPNCFFGLHNNYSIMQLMSLSGPVIYAGCWAATLSTALTNLLSVPRLIQALGVDRIYPGLIFFAKPYGRHGEPYRGYVLTFLVSLLFLLIADLNRIAPLITNFYLASYALINFCTFHAAFIEHISWRPSFKYYNTWVSFIGFLMCIAIMMIISWVMALVTVLIFIALYLVVLYRNPAVNWGSSTDAQKYKDTVAALVQMTHVLDSAKSYNPQLLVLAGQPFARPALLDVAHLITKVGSFMIVADINEAKLSYAERTSRSCIGEDWLHSRKIRGFYVLIEGFDFENGVRALIQAAGLGKLAPNIMFIGYKNNWMTDTKEGLRSYVRVIQEAFEYQLAVAVLRLPTTLLRKQSKTIAMVPETGRTLDLPYQTQIQAVLNADSNIDFTSNDAEPLDHDYVKDNNKLEAGTAYTETLMSLEGSDLKRRADNISDVTDPIFKSKKVLTLNSENDSLDTWWLYDDGGLNILLSYIVALRGFKIPLRIFALAKTGQRIEDAEEQVKTLLQQFRINYSSLTMIKGINEKPTRASVELFNNLIQHFKTGTANGYLVTEAELLLQQSKTDRQLRIRELLLENSRKASLIVMSLPLPRQGVPAALYMTWLEVLGRDLPPMLFVRGNDSSVLST